MSAVRVTEFTDPYCTWCWGAEPVRRRLLEVYRDGIEFDYVMGGLAEDFEQFVDPAGDVSDEGDVGPHWQSASRQHGMPVDARLWREDPPDSTYPACVAYVAASFQGRDLADAFLRRMREAGAAGGANLERVSVLVDLAADVSLDVEQFREDHDSDAAWEAFRADQQCARQHGATAFPTFMVEFDGGRELLRGYRPFPTFEKLFTEADVGLEQHEPRSIPDLLEHYGRMATVEVAEIHDIPETAAGARLGELASEGLVRSVPAGNDYFWGPA